MKYIYGFYKSNNHISRLLIIATIIIFLYYISLDWPEWFEHAGDLFLLFYNLLLGYVVNFGFYVNQIYIPDYKKTTQTNKIVNKRLQMLLEDMHNMLRQLARTVSDTSSEEYTDETFYKVLCLKSTDELKVINLAKIANIKTSTNYTLSEWIIEMTKIIEADIHNLLAYYNIYIQTDVLDILEEILRSEMHGNIKIFMSTPGIFTLNDEGPNYYKDYYMLYMKLSASVSKSYI